MGAKRRSRGILFGRRTGGDRHGHLRASRTAREIHRHGGRRRARAHPDGQPARIPASNIDHVQQRVNCPNQSAYIVVDESTGERTVLWNRPDCLAHRAGSHHARTDRLRAPAAHRRARHGGRGTRRAHRPASMPSRSPSMWTPSTPVSNACCRWWITWSQAPNFLAAGQASTIPSPRLRAIQGKAACVWRP